MNIFKFKEVAHLYMGCQFKVEVVNTPNLTCDTHPLMVGDIITLNSYWYNMYMSNCFTGKPLLRKIPDVPMDKWPDLFGGGHLNPPSESEIKEWRKSFILNGQPINEDYFKPSTLSLWISLLKNGIDCFKLIENNEAIRG